MPRRHKRVSLKRWWLLPAAVLVAAAVLFATGRLPGVSPPARANGESGDSTAVAALAADDSTSEAIAVPVELARAASRTLSEYYRTASVVEADRLVGVISEGAGLVRRLHVEEGDRVAAGQILAELENEREKVQLRQTELRLADAQRLLERQEAMRQEGLISDQSFDEARSAHDLAETERDLARIALQETIVRAPFAGIITEREVVTGQQVGVGTTLFALGDLDPLRIKVHLPEPVARRVAPGDTVVIVPEAAGRSLWACVERIAPVVDPATSTVQVTLALADADLPPDAAMVGGFVKVRIQTDVHAEALAIPKVALIEEGGLRSVFVAEADTVRKVEVRTGLFDDSHVEVLSGLDAGEFVVTLGQGGLRTGTAIEVLNGEDVGWPSRAGGPGNAAPLALAESH
jgi:membrane fusion protein (multidrug efflux system)